MSKDVQEMKIVKPTSQTIIETIEFVIMTAATYYIVRPDKRERHLAILRKQRDIIRTWIDVQDTLASIRGLPETDD